MILADTSAWVEYDRATGSPVDQRMLELIDHEPEQLGVTPPVIAEVAMCARSNIQERELRRLLGRHPLLDVEAATDFDGATRIYRMCRRHGVTPHDMVDCLVAAVAIRHDAALLAADADMTAIASVMHLQLDPASPSA